MESPITKLVIEKTKNVKTMKSKNKILKKLKNEGIAVVENYFDENKGLIVPEALKKYVNFEFIPLK